MHIIIIINVIMHEITLGLAEAMQKQGLSLLQSSDWSDL